MKWWCSASGAAWSWTWTPYVGAWIVVVGLAALLWRTGAYSSDRPTSRRIAAALAPAVLLLATDWPLAALGAGYLVTAQMIRQVLVVMVFAPMLLFAAPPGIGRRLAASGRAGRLLRIVTTPLVALLVADGLLVALNTPPVVDAMIGSPFGSFAIDAVWVVVGLLVWLPVQPPEGLEPRITGIGTTVYLIAVSIIPLPVAFFMTWSHFPIYSTFELAPRVVSSLGAQADQELAAAVFQVAGGLVIWIQIVYRFVTMAAEGNTRSPRIVPSSGGPAS